MKEKRDPEQGLQDFTSASPLQQPVHSRASAYSWKFKIIISAYTGHKYGSVSKASPWNHIKSAFVHKQRRKVCNSINNRSKIDHNARQRS